MMERLKNIIKVFKEKVGQKTNAKVAEPIDNTSFEDDMVVVSDYAVAQGAQCNEPTGDPIKDRYHWINRNKLAPIYRLKIHDSSKEIIYHDQVVGITPVLNNIFSNEFSIRGGYLAHQHEYTYFPQKRVDQALNEYLTDVAINKRVKLAANEFGKISGYLISSYSDDKKNGIKQSYYYYQGKPYCLRVDKNHKDNQYQWFNLDLIMAKQVDDKICCEDVLFADHAFDKNKFVDDLKHSIVLNHTIPYFLQTTQTPQQKPEDERIKD